MKHSGDPWTASSMLQNNARHESGVRAFLTRIVHDPQNHAKFLNMLSMLEHMGSRKIMVSQMNAPQDMDLDTLQHMAEEARHAYFFKRHAERINGSPMKGWTEENVMARAAALMYFGRMDAGITKRLEKLSSLRKQGSSEGRKKDPRLHGGGTHFEPYGWVSLIIELRACWLYGIYNDVVERAGVHLPLKGLIAEEDGHLAEMFEKCGDDHDLLKELSVYETTLFEKLWGVLEASYPKPLENVKAA